MNIAVAFITTLIPRELEIQIKNLSKGNMQEAASALQWHIYDGLSANLENRLNIFNILPIGSFPQYYREAFVKKSEFYSSDNVRHSNLGFCNVKLIRKYSQSRNLQKAIDKWCRQNNKIKIIFVYTISATFLKVISYIKRKYKDVVVCAIVADLPDMTDLSKKKSIVRKLFIHKFANESYSRLTDIDCFVLLTNHMASYMKINKPYCVVEGISTYRPKNDNIRLEDTKTILYTGTLHEKFGILNLLDAFQLIENPNYRLIICGSGDCEKRIKKICESNNRIEYKGIVSRNEALELQNKSTVLVNPRQNNEIFTKYSFPSKNMEYLSSGRPLIAYKLDGIPDEYDKYIFYVKDNSVESLKNKILEVCEMPIEELNQHCNEAYEFVLKNKNDRVQTKKIIKMIKEKIVLYNN